LGDEIGYTYKKVQNGGIQHYVGEQKSKDARGMRITQDGTVLI